MSTKTDILEAAEVLFATNGYDGTSLRQITDEAGANIAAVNYHFGTKEALLTAVLDRVITPITIRRLELLDQAESAASSTPSGHPDLRIVLTTFLQPDLESIASLRARNQELPRFVARMYGGGFDTIGEITAGQFAETQRRFLLALSRVLPDLDRGEILWRLHCVVGIVVYFFSGVSDYSESPLFTGAIERDLDRLLSVTEALMSAPASPSASPTPTTPTTPMV